MQTAGWLLIIGSTVFAFGAGIGVPRMWSERDPQVRQRMLEERKVIWRIAQPIYGLGAIISGVGVGYLAVDATNGGTRTAFAVAGLAMTGGALAWGWSLYLRGARIADFVFGRQPGWPFMTYVLLTIGGLALLGLGLLTGGFPVWLGWLTIVADLAFLAGYLRTKDIVPFVFYLLLTVVGVVLL